MKKVVSFGEIMLRLATPDYLRFAQTNKYNATFGGGEANVAIALSNFGLETEFVTCLPQNPIADHCLEEVRQYGVRVDRSVRGGNRIGIYYLETGAVARSSKVIYDRENSSMAELRPGQVNWRAIFKDTQWFHWSGITPAISQSAADACLEAIQIANEMEITISADLNYRRNLWKYGKEAKDVLPEMVKLSDILIAGEKDAQMLFGIKVDPLYNSSVGAKGPLARFESIGVELMSKYPHLKKVVTTFRGMVNANYNTWKAALFDGNKLYQSKSYDLTHIVDRIGGGDSFMGGLIYGWITYGDDQKALDFAVAASALKHTIFGDQNLATVSEVENLMKGDGSGRVSR